MAEKFDNVDDYINSFPKDVQELLQAVRKTIQENVPEATEEMAYGMPAFRYNGKRLIYYAAFSKHIGLYAMTVAHDKFKKRLSAYKQGKGSVQFPFTEPIPLDLIAEIVKFRVEESQK